MSLLDELPTAGLVPVILAAHEAGILDDLREGLGVESLAQKRGLDVRATQLVVDALCALELCAREGERVVWRRRVDDGYPWTELGAFLRQGTIERHLDNEATRAALYPQVVAWLSDRTWGLARELARVLPARAHVVDVGAGGGAWSLAMAEAHEQTRVTDVDLAEVLPRFEERARSLGLAGRVSTLAGSYFEVTPPADFDRVVFANVLHLESPEDCRRLLRRFAAALRPGGDLVIVDCLGDEGVPAYARFRAFYGLHLGMRTRRGGVHEERDLREWCAAAGLPEVRRVSVPGSGGLAALVASRPG